MIRRRDFIAGLAVAPAPWTLASQAQQDGPIRRVGMLIAGGDRDLNILARVAAFRDALTKLGWQEGRNLRTDVRFGTGDSDRMKDSAAELIGIAPEVSLVSSTPAARALRELSPSIPIVFVTIADPVASGLVANLFRPEGNATGFALHDPSIGGKMVELLKEAAPQVSRIGHIFDPANIPQVYFGAIETATQTFNVQSIRMPVRSAVDIVRAIDSFGIGPNGGLLTMPDNTIGLHRETIIRLAAYRRLPSIFPFTFFAEKGALLSYGSDVLDQYRRAASYVDRFLRGTKLIELPVQLPTQFNLTINVITHPSAAL
jgi:putative tryptophan/tyrosine transport system substrate-binding protein